MIKLSYAVLRKMHEKKAVAIPLALGAGVAAGVHLTRKSLNKSKEYQAGFVPGIGATNE
jgi:hypothetical protein